MFILLFNSFIRK